IQLIATGNPVANLQLVEIPKPSAPASGEVIIKMEYSPINPSDLMMANGVYFIQPELPAVIGGEGVGVIVEAGADVHHIKVGERVVVPFGTYAWAEFVKAPAENLFSLSAFSDVKQAAMASINPPTAILLLNEYVDLEKGDWIVLNAGNSSVANTIIAVAKSRGIKTVAIVRRAEAVEAATAAGADIVIVESPTAVQQVKEATGGANIKLGLDAVGGQSSSLLAQILGQESHLVAYAVLSGQPMVVSQVDLIVKGLKVHGFWMYLSEYLPKLNSAVRESNSLIASKLINVPIAASYPLSAIKEAVEHTIRGEKVLLDFTN
ncbi:MAG: zinc-dependent alcohol dehydrogenase family protein, partial [Pedobacter sp.]|nr:zinc-dependent alcohol dehydrogenase family protein [Pedobacter sp.]